MFADDSMIKWLLENRTQYFINKNTGVPQSTISDIKTGKKDLNNITFGNAARLTELAVKEKNTASNE